MKTKIINFKLFGTIFILLTIFSGKAFAAFPTEFWPQAGQTAEWTVTSENELSFSGAQPASSPAIVATTFGGLLSNDYTGLTIKFDAFISFNGAEKTSIVLSSNATWGSTGKGVIIEASKYLIQGLSNFVYPGTMLTSDVSTYQNTIVQPGAYNSFIIVVSPTGEISVTINGYLCPTTYAAPIGVLTAPAPVPRFVYICAGFNGFKLRNLKVVKDGNTRQYFLPFTPLSGTYYIDAINGSDIATGLSEVEAWKSFENVNRTVLTAGTKILLKKGSVWNQRLEIRGAGTVTNWISVGAYGTDPAKPKISLTNNANDIGLLISDLDKTTGIVKQQNISYIEVKDVEISNTRLGIYYRDLAGTVNTGFRVSNVTFNNINCDPVMTAINSAANKVTEISNQLSAIKGNLQTINGATDGGVNEYVFPCAIFIGGQTFGNQTVTGNHTTVLTELDVSSCQFNDAIAGVMSVFYWPFVSGGASNIWRQIVNKVKVSNCSGTGIVNGIVGFDGVNGGAVADVNGVMQPDANGWGVIKNTRVTIGSAVPGRTWPNGTTAVIFSNTQNFLVDSCEFSGMLNQGNPDGCGFDFETNNNLVTIQNTKFLNNDGHSILLMNGGNFGGNTNLVLQKNLFSGNVKFSDSTYELNLGRQNDGTGVHQNVKIRNNIFFFRKLNKNNQSIGFYNTTSRTYVTATDNDRYYLAPTAAAVTISFLGLPYTYNATKSAVAIPVLSSISINGGATTTTSQSVSIASVVTKAAAAYYMVSESSAFTGAVWTLYNSPVNFTLSAALGLKTIYFKVKNIAGTSVTRSSTIQLIAPLKVGEMTTDNINLNYWNQTSVQVYPNPVSNVLNISFVNEKNDKSEHVAAEDDNYQVTVISLTGALCETIQKTGNSFNLDFSKFAAGTYLIRFKGNKNVFTKTVVKQ